MTPQSCCTPTSPTALLLEAIKKLEAYASRQEHSTSRLQLSKTFAKLRSLFSHDESGSSKSIKQRIHRPTENEINDAIEIINRSRFLIEKLRRGTEDERELAESLTETIARYNSGCDLRITKYVGKQPLFPLFRQKRPDSPPKIALPPKITVSCHFPGENLSQTALKNETARAAAAILVPKQSAELFHMKAIALLEQHGIASNHEARAIIKSSPIHIEQENDTSRCTLVQTLTLFPGQTITVKGSSSLDPKNSTIQKLFPKTFSLTLESTQTGFPDPSQRSGWALAGQLLPFSPQRIDLLAETAPLFQKRLMAIAGLQPKGDLLKRAKSLIAARKQTFNKNSGVLLPLHRKLAEAFISAGSEGRDTTRERGAIALFFDTLSQDPKPFELLCLANRRVAEQYLVDPRKKLIDKIIKGKDTSLGSDNADKRFKAVEQLYDELIDDCIAAPSESEYIASMGHALARAAKGIVLQYLSEDLIYPPPRLTPFQITVQAAACRQLDGFLTELFMNEEIGPAPLSPTLLEKMKGEIAEDIALFSGANETSVAREIAGYFAERHASLSGVGA